VKIEKDEVEPGRFLISMRRKLVASVTTYASVVLILGVLSSPGFLSDPINETEGSGPFLQIKTLGSLWYATYSPTGDHIATTDSSGVRIWDAINGDIVANFSSNTSVWNHVWSPTGNHLATFANRPSPKSPSNPFEREGMIHIWDTSSGGEVARIEDVIVPMEWYIDEREISSWSPDGTRICVIKSDGPVVFDLISGSFAFPLEGVNATSVRWSPSGNIIATTFERSLFLFNAKDGSPINQFQLKKSGDPDCTTLLCAYDFSPQGDKIAIAGNTKPSVEIVDIDTGDLIKTVDYAPLSGMIAGISKVSWSSEGKIAILPMCVLPDDTVGIYDFVTDETVYISEAYYEERGLYSSPEIEWSRDGSRLAVFGDLSGYVSIWSSEGELLSRWRAGERSVQASWSGSNDLLCLAVPGSTLKTSDTLGNEINNFAGYNGQIRSMSWGPSNTIVTAGEMLRIWSAENGSQLGVLSQPNQTATIVEWHPGNLIASYIRPPDFGVDSVTDHVENQRITFFDAFTGKIMNRLDRDARHGFATDIAYSPNGSLIASCWNTGEVAVRLVETGDKVWGTLNKDIDATDLAWSPNASRLAVIYRRYNNCEPSGGMLEIYDPLNGSRLLRMPLTAWPSDLAWSDDGSMIAISKRGLPFQVDTMGSGILDVIDPWTGNLLANATGPPAHSVLWTENNTIILGHDDGIRFWESSTGQLIGHQGDVRGSMLEWSPDRTILAASDSDTIEFWYYHQLQIS
jgi:hypothetical protein